VVGLSNLKQENIVMRAMGLGLENDCADDDLQLLYTDLSFPQRRRPTSTNPELTVMKI
jgi:hypothetical protein